MTSVIGYILAEHSTLFKRWHLGGWAGIPPVIEGREREGQNREKREGRRRSEEKQHEGGNEGTKGEEDLCQTCSKK